MGFSVGDDLCDEHRRQNALAFCCEKRQLFRRRNVGSSNLFFHNKLVGKCKQKKKDGSEKGQVWKQI